jgi:catechol 2,3-dioxygenase-like lactoylglutathione lyase family enzyme
MDLGWFEIALDVQDIGRSAAFYEALGFQRVAGEFDRGFLTLQSGDCRLSLLQGYLNPPQAQLIFWQGDPEAILRELKARGVEFEKFNVLRDPDGQPLYFVNEAGVARRDPATPSEPALGRFEAALNVQDIDRTQAFYETLGFRRVDDGRHAPGIATLRQADCRISLYRGHLDPPETQLIFWQGDIESIARTLTSRGLSFEKGPTRFEGGGGSVALKDPDGHTIFLINMPGVVRGEPARA